MRLAVVSSDGKNVDLHLGRGNSIYVYTYTTFLNTDGINKLDDKIP